MPCYNAAGTVSRAISSIITQTFTSWELIIVDDGSEDNSAEIIRSHANLDDRIRLVRAPHQGVVAASNLGFEHSTAPYIARMDADDESLPRRLQAQVDFLEKDTTLGAASCLTHFAGDPIAAGGYAHHVEWTNTHLTPGQIELNRFIDLPFPHPTLMYRREIIQSHGGYRQGAFPEDYEMILRWIDSGIRIGKVNQPLYRWYDPPYRLSRNDSRYDMSAFHQIKAPYLASAIKKSACAHRDLWIWGAGRPARKCARTLEESWKSATGFIDIDPRKIGRSIQNRPVVSSKQLPEKDNAVIVSYVGTRGAREKIRAELLTSGRKEGTDFWLAC